MAARRLNAYCLLDDQLEVDAAIFRATVFAVVRCNRMEVAEASRDQTAGIDAMRHQRLTHRLGTLLREHQVVSLVADAVGVAGDLHGDIRSEEHTSELQSLMRISYAVFCLK